MAAPLVLAVLLLGSACRQDMHDQPKLRGLRGDPFFSDGRGARPAIPHTVSRDALRDDDHLYTGKEQGKFVETFPFPVSREVMLRGQQRFDIFCSPCHGWLGYGNGMVVRRGLSRPPSFHIDRLRNAQVGYLFDVITNGFGRMQDYAAQIPTEDRWAIVAYVRVLQRSQNATLEDVSAGRREKLLSEGQKQ